MSTRLPPTPNQQRVLDYINANAGCSIGSIIAGTGLVREAVRAAIASLYSRKLIGRQAPLLGVMTWTYYPADYLLSKHEPEPVIEPPRPRAPAPPKRLIPDRRPAIDEYWESHPDLTREQAERAFQRRMQRIVGVSS